MLYAGVCTRPDDGACVGLGDDTGARASDRRSRLVAPTTVGALGDREDLRPLRGCGGALLLHLAPQRPVESHTNVCTLLSLCVLLLLLRLCQTPSGDEFATGSYGNTTMVVGSDGQNHGWFEAGRQLLLQRPWRGPPERAKLDQRIMSLVRVCFLRFASNPPATDRCPAVFVFVCGSALQTWHPTERMLAVAAENTMYIHADAGGKSA